MKAAWTVGMVVFVGLVMGVICAGNALAAHTFTAVLTGDRETAKVVTEAKATATFTLNDEKTEIAYKLEVTNLKDAIGAHIHMGLPGKNGEPVVLLFTGPEKTGMFSGVLAEGKLTADSLVGPYKGKTIANLANAMAKGELYVNVHTKANPDGELRGQIK